MRPIVSTWASFETSVACVVVDVACVIDVDADVDGDGDVDVDCDDVIC
jgi:hypothetical protein